MRPGAHYLLDFLVRRGARNAGVSWWAQQRIADDLGVSRASIIRWAAELVRLGLIESTRRGSISNLYQVKGRDVSLWKSCGKPPIRATSNVANCNNVGGPVIITEVKESESKQGSAAKPAPNPPRKPAASEKRAPQPAVVFRGRDSMLLSAKIVAMIPRIEDCRDGTRQYSQDFIRVRDAILRARERIERARSPDAYVCSIVQRELAGT